MAGVKGRSGRRTRSEEQKRRDVLQKAWSIYEEMLSSDEVSTVEKAKLVQTLITKDIPQVVEGNKQAPLIIEVVDFGTKN